MLPLKFFLCAMDNLFLSFGGPLVLVEDKIMFLKVTLSVKVDPYPILYSRGIMALN